MKKIFVIMSVIAMAWMTIGMMSAETFVKVNSVSELKDGDKVVLACETKGKISAGFDASSSNKQLACTAATFANGKTTVDNPTVITLTKTGNNWNLYIGSKVIGHEATTANSVDFKSGTTSDFSITITNGNAVIQSKTGTTAFPKFYSNTSSGKFRLYNSTSQNPIQLYKLDEGSVPEKKVTKVTLNKETSEVRMGATETLSVTIEPNDAVDKSIAWGSTDESVATVANGKVTPKAVGTTKIWAKATAVENISDTCIVYVLPTLNTNKASYKIVQKRDYLSAGAKVFFGSLKSSENYVMSRYASGTNIKVAAATYDEEHHTAEAELQYAYTVQRAGDYYVFVDQDGYYLRTQSSTSLAKSRTLDQYAKWVIGEFNADDATVEIKNVGCSQYLYYNCNSDLFNVYDYKGNNLDANFTKVVLYSSEAPAWANRPKDPWIKVSTDYLDWGDVDKDPWATEHPWDESKDLTISSNDLTQMIKVELKDNGNGTFYCYGDDFNPATRPSETFANEWKAASTGEYTGRLEISCPELDTVIVVTLHAKAVDKANDPQYQPKFYTDVTSIYLNPNWEVESSDFGKDNKNFTFSAENLAKKLYCNLRHDSQTSWFVSGDEYITVTINGTTIGINDQMDLGKEDIIDAEVDINVYAYNKGRFQCELNFYSLKADSKTERAIDVTIPITVNVTEVATEIEKVQGEKVQCTKVIKNGVLYLIYKGKRIMVNGLVD